MKTCEKCGNQIDDKAVMCVHCGCRVKKKKPIFKKWWFWTIIAVLVIGIIGGSSGGSGDDTTDGTQTGTTSETTQNTEAEKEQIRDDVQNGTTSSTTQNTDPEKEQNSYEVVDLQAMIDELDANAMRAEEKYQNKYIEVTGKISNIDSDGSYISIDPVGDDFNLTGVLCYIKNGDQKAKIMEKSKGDTITIKGKVKSIGEVLGYSIDIKEIV